MCGATWGWPRERGDAALAPHGAAEPHLRNWMSAPTARHRQLGPRCPFGLTEENTPGSGRAAAWRPPGPAEPPGVAVPPGPAGAALRARPARPGAGGGHAPGQAGALRQPLGVAQTLVLPSVIPSLPAPARSGPGPAVTVTAPSPAPPPAHPPVGHVTRGQLTPPQRRARGAGRGAVTRLRSDCRVRRSRGFEPGPRRPGCSTVYPAIVTGASDRF